uniref:Uncharacterized protein n=1 Tax=Anguilla anguilla TaxID=7936 RepID=A0A0E9REQ9_ANGAN
MQACVKAQWLLCSKVVRCCVVIQRTWLVTQWVQAQISRWGIRVEHNLYCT